MRPEYEEANKLLDVFASRDRAAAKATLVELKERVGEKVYQRAVYLANQQYQMYEKDHRLHSWRADWTAEQKRARANDGEAGTDSERESDARVCRDDCGQGAGDTAVPG